MFDTLDRVDWGSFDHGLEDLIRDLPTENGCAAGEALARELFGDDPARPARITELVVEVLPFAVAVVETPGDHHRAGALVLLADAMDALPEHFDERGPAPGVSARALNAAYFRLRRCHATLRRAVPAVVDLLRDPRALRLDERALAVDVLVAMEDPAPWAPLLREHGSPVDLAPRVAATLPASERVLWIGDVLVGQVGGRGDAQAAERARRAVQGLLAPPGARPLPEAYLQELFLRLGLEERELLNGWMAR